MFRNIYNILLDYLRISYHVLWSYLPLSQLFQIHSLSLPIELCVLFLFKEKKKGTSSVICAAHMFLDVWPSAVAWETYQGRETSDSPYPAAKNWQ